MNARDIHAAIVIISKALPDIERALNEADSRIGDGDTGGMLARVVRGLATVVIDENDVGAYLVALSKAASGATGSSLGNLIATALGTMGRRSTGQASLRPPELAGLLAAARDAMLERGGADLGDKTIIDSMHALSEAAAGVERWEDMRHTAAKTAADALVSFRGRRILIGRARMFGDATRELDDPGMLAAAMLLGVACGVLSPEDVRDGSFQFNQQKDV